MGNRTLHTLVGRTSRAVVPLVLLGVLAACQPPPPPTPTGLPAPTVTDIEISPVVQAGEAVTATMRVNHPAGVAWTKIALRGPNGERLGRADGSGACETTPSTQTYVMTEPGVETEVAANCTTPANATNGVWEVTVTVQAKGSYVPTQVTGTVQIAGGADDAGAPVVTAINPVPANAAAGSTFHLAFRIEDAQLTTYTDTNPANFLFRNAQGRIAGAFYCVDHQENWVSPTVLETSMTCNVPIGQVPGSYVLELFPIQDLFGLSTTASFGPVIITA